MSEPSTMESSTPLENSLQAPNDRDSSNRGQQRELNDDTGSSEPSDDENAPSKLSSSKASSEHSSTDEEGNEGRENKFASEVESASSSEEEDVVVVPSKSETHKSNEDDESEKSSNEHKRKSAGTSPVKQPSVQRVQEKDSSSETSSSGEEESSSGEEEKTPVAPVKNTINAKTQTSESSSESGFEEENEESDEEEKEITTRQPQQPPPSKKAVAKVSDSSASENEDEDSEEEGEEGESSSEDEETAPASKKEPKSAKETSSSSSSEEEEESEEEESEEDEDEDESGEEESDIEARMPTKKSASSKEPVSTGESVHHRSKKAAPAKAKARSRRDTDDSGDSSSSSSSSGSSSSGESDEEEEESGSESSDSSASEGSASKKNAKSRIPKALLSGCKRVKKVSAPVLSKVSKVLTSSRFGPQLVKLKNRALAATTVVREDFQEIRRLRRSLSSKPRHEWSLKQLPTRTRLAIGRVFLLVVFSVLLLILLGSGSSGFSLRSTRKRSSLADYPLEWRKTRQLNFEQLMNLINVHDNNNLNNTSVKIKKLPSLEKPVYITMTSKDLVQIKRPAVRKKRPDEPRAVRTFGCLRDGCRGLEIEDLLDRGWQMRFRAAQKNDSYKNINYRVTFLLTDTTQLNHMRAVRPDLYESVYNTYEGKSYLIAFDGADAIGGNKGQQLKVKERFVRKYGCKFSELAISPSSYRLYLKDECEDLVAFGSSDATWLLKPETGSQGQGITFHTEITDIMQKQPKFFPCAEKEWKATERYLVQEYIEHPLLLKKCKFDARVYMNIASGSPFLVWYHEGYLRRALAPYTPLSRDRRVYLTNTHFQSMKKDFKLSEHIWSFPEFQAYLKEQGRTGAHYIESILNPQIKKVALFIFHSARQKLKKRKGTFHIMGLDFMIDEDFHIWFIEANGFPGFTWSINFDTRTMVEEWFNMAQQVHENPRFYMLMREGDRYGGFEMIFSELEEERSQTLYNPCQEFKFNRGYTAPLKEANRLFAQISGKGGKTERFKRYVNTVKGAHLIGGSRADQIKAREAYFHKFGCRPNNVHFMPPMYALYDSEQCNNFFTEHSTSNAPWVVKPVSGPGNGEELRVFANQAAMKEQFGDCSSSRVPDFVVQQLIPDRPLVSFKWWDIRVYMLIANTRPWMVFYHHGFARTSKLSYVPGGEAETSGQEGAAQAAADKDDEEDAVELEEEEGGEDDDKGGKDSGEGGGKSSGEPGAGGDDAMDAAQAAAAAAAAANGDPNALLNQPPAEPWAPPKITTGAQFTLGEEFMTLEAMEDEMARADLVGSRWLSSVFDTYAKKVAHLLFQSARDELERGNETYQITSLNFILDHKLQINFIDATNVDADSIPNVDVLQEHKANFLETLAGLTLELHTLPAAFARMRRGDSYGQWRLVFSEMEERQRTMTYDPCDEFKRNLQVSKSSLFKDAWLHQHTLKSHARNKRELRKYIDRKWESSCKNKPTAELRASCIRNTISYRYKKYIEKERVPYQEGYVENYIRELEHRPKTTGTGGGQGGGL